MEELVSSESRLAKICETIREEALLPSRIEAQTILENARKEAEEIKRRAKEEAHRLLEDSKKEILRHKQIVESSLEQAGRQVIEQLKDKIETKLFAPNLTDWVKSQLDTEQATTSLADALVQAVVREGTASDLTVELPKSLSNSSVIAQLGEKFLKELGRNPIHIGPQTGGVILKLKNGLIEIDVSDTVITELMGSFLRKDFRRYVFGGINSNKFVPTQKLS